MQTVVSLAVFILWLNGREFFLKFNRFYVRKDVVLKFFRCSDISGTFANFFCNMQNEVELN